MARFKLALANVFDRFPRYSEKPRPVPPEVVKAVEALSKDENEQVREAVATALFNFSEGDRSRDAGD